MRFWQAMARTASLFLTLTGCAFSESSPRSLGAALNFNDPTFRGTMCPSARLSNRPDLADPLREAMTDACAVLTSDEFRLKVQSRRFALKCSGVFSTQRLLAGAEVFSALATGLPAEFTLTIRDVRRATAETIASDRTMAIDPAKLTDWANGERSARAGTINTLVHEMSHLVREGGDSIWPLFQDKGSSLPWCGRDRLASYALGDIAEEVWKDQHPA